MQTMKLVLTNRYKYSAYLKQPSLMEDVNVLGQHLRNLSYAIVGHLTLTLNHTSLHVYTFDK